MSLPLRSPAPALLPALLAGCLVVVTVAASQGVPGAPAASEPSAPRPPAPTLTPPSTATMAADADGFLRRWLVLEPIRTNGQLTDSAVRALVNTTHFPDQLTTLPRDGETVVAGEDRLTWHAVDTSLYNVNLYHFAYALDRPTSNVLFWAVTVIDVPREMVNVRLAIGSNSASVWWVNGDEVITLFNDRQSVIDDGVSDRLTLKAGRNVIRAAIVNAGGATDFCARLLDADDRPITSVTVALPTSGK